MAHSDETLSVAWCDTGTVDSMFMGGIVNLLSNWEIVGAKKGGFFSVTGNMIHKQRQQMIDEWYASGNDWLLWVDSDVVISAEMIKTLWDVADKNARPVVCGVYFVTPNPNKPMMTPYPCIFKYEGELSNPVHPLPVNKLIKIDTAGMGLCLMHRSVVDMIKEPYEGTYFDVSIGKVNRGEDISFFLKLKEQGIPVYAHTGVVAQHIKRFSFDIQYYDHFWKNVKKN